jgi:hypothetical protein
MATKSVTLFDPAQQSVWQKRLGRAVCTTLVGWVFCQASAQQTPMPPSQTPAPIQMPVPVQTPTPGANNMAQPGFQPAPAYNPVPVQMPNASPPRAPSMAEQMVNTPPPPPPVVIQPAAVVVPPGVVYVAPTYAAPGIGWVWDYHPRYGWGWRHPEHGWHRRW